MRRLGPADYRRMPWKNGGGETVELAIDPPGATLTDFDWRISSATVAIGGPFSAFPGVDRSLAVIDGGALLLHVAPVDEGAGPLSVRLTPADPPFVFAGEQAVTAELADPDAGPLTDFNVMTRRGRWAHRLQCLHVQGRAELAPEGELLVLYCAGGSVRCRGGGASLALAAGEALIVPATGAQGRTLELHAAPAACLYAAHLMQTGACQ